MILISDCQKGDIQRIHTCTRGIPEVLRLLFSRKGSLRYSNKILKKYISIYYAQNCQILPYLKKPFKRYTHLHKVYNAGAGQVY